MTKNELKKITDSLNISNYLNIVCFNLENDLNMFKLLYENMINYERPDMISIIEKYIVPIEHFEFDGGSKINNGILFKKTENDFINFLKMKSQYNDSVHEVKPINVNITNKNYINNFIEIYNKHYKKIPYYIKNVSESYQNFIITKVWFFIEDSLPFTPTSDGEDIFLFKIKQFIDILENSSNLGGIIYKTYSNGKNVIYMLKNNNATIAYLRKNEIDINNINLFFPKINIIGLVENNLQTLNRKMKEIENKNDL